LVPFDERDAGVFVGGDLEIASLLEILESTRLKSRSGERLLLLLGASGSGKSSLVRAGVLPRLIGCRNAGSYCRRCGPGSTLCVSLPSA
jgi:hypothetical protein